MKCWNRLARGCAVVTAVVGLGAGVAFGDEAAAFYEINVPTDGVQTNLTADQVKDVTTNTWAEIRKTGGGTLVINDRSGIGTYKGTLRIADGVWVLGPSAGTSSTGSSGIGVCGTCQVIVEKGATLETDLYSGVSATYYHSHAKIKLAGTGYAGKTGALVIGRSTAAEAGVTDNSAYRSFYLVAWEIELTDDATIAHGGYHCYFSTKNTIDLKGHTLTITTPTKTTKQNALDFRTNDVYAGEPTRVISDGTLVIENNSSYKYNGYLVADPGVQANLVLNKSLTWDGTIPAGLGNFNLVIQGGAKTVSFPNTIDWNGTITADPGATISLAAAEGKVQHVNGAITGDVNVVSASGNCRLVCLSGTNTFTGKLTMTCGTLALMHTNALPGDVVELIDAGKIQGRAASGYPIAFALQTAARPEGWSPEAAGRIVQKFYGDKDAPSKWSCGAYVDAGYDGNILFDMTAAGATNHYGSMYFNVYGGGRAVIKTVTDDDLDYHLFNTVLTSADIAMSNIVYSMASPEGKWFNAKTESGFNVHITYENINYLMGSWIYWYLVGTRADPDHEGEITVGTNACVDCINGKGGRGLYACGNEACCAARITLLPGGIISNAVWIGSTDVTSAYGQRASYIQRGGALRHYKDAGIDNHVSIGGATNGLAYMELNAGELTVGGNDIFYLGSGGHGKYPSARTVYDQRGGDVDVKSVWIGRPGHVRARVTGGTFRSRAATCMPQDERSNYMNGDASLTVAEDAEVTIPGITLAARVNSTSSVTVADGALVKTPFICKAKVTPSRKVDTSNAVAIVNFNGGGIEAAETAAILGGAAASLTMPVDHAYIWEKGAVFRNGDGVVSTVDAALEAPVGNGVTAIAIPEGMRTNYSASAYVEIVGDGVGATAIAEYDSVANVITRITVTNPGVGYTQENTKAYLFVGGVPSKAWWEVNVTVGANATTGGLTKEGAGTLVLNAANTYGGNTVLKGGVLELGTANALPGGTTLAYQGGTLAATAANSPAALTVTLPDPDNLEKCALITYTDAKPAQMPAVTFTNGKVGAWGLRYSGNTLQARKLRGTVVTFR